jgi:hypothetical protein
MGLLTLSKDVLRDEGTPRLIKFSCEIKLSDVGYFNNYK